MARLFLTTTTKEDAMIKSTAACAAKTISILHQDAAATTTHKVNLAVVVDVLHPAIATMVNPTNRVLAWATVVVVAMMATDPPAVVDTVVVRASKTHLFTAALPEVVDAAILMEPVEVSMEALVEDMKPVVCVAATVVAHLCEALVVAVLSTTLAGNMEVVNAIILAVAVVVDLPTSMTASKMKPPEMEASSMACEAATECKVTALAATTVVDHLVNAVATVDMVAMAVTGCRAMNAAITVAKWMKRMCVACHLKSSKDSTCAELAVAVTCVCAVVVVEPEALVAL